MEKKAAFGVPTMLYSLVPNENQSCLAVVKGYFELWVRGSWKWMACEMTVPFFFFFFWIRNQPFTKWKRLACKFLKEKQNLLSCINRLCHRSDDKRIQVKYIIIMSTNDRRLH